VSIEGVERGGEKGKAGYADVSKVAGSLCGGLRGLQQRIFRYTHQSGITIHSNDHVSSCFSCGRAGGDAVMLSLGVAGKLHFL
jgi:hypothetical protein